jgi:hypothetical protein
VDPRASQDDVEKRKFVILPGLELRPLGRPIRSQSLYRLRLDKTQNITNTCFNIYNLSSDENKYAKTP